MVAVDIDIIETVEMVTQVIKCGIGHTQNFCGISHNWLWKWSQKNCDHFHYNIVPKYTDANQTRKCIGALSHNHLYLWTKSQYPLEYIGIGPNSTSHLWNRA